MKPIYLFAAVVFLGGCSWLPFGKSDDTTDDVGDEVQAVTSETTEAGDKAVNNAAKSGTKTPLGGTYFAKIKHSECGSLRVNIVLESNQTYEKVIECMRGESDPYYENGQWLQADNAIMLESPQPIETTPPMTRLLLKGNALQLADEPSVLFKKR